MSWLKVRLSPERPVSTTKTKWVIGSVLALGIRSQLGYEKSGCKACVKPEMGSN